MAIVNKPDMNYGTWAENGNIEIPSSEKVEEGWVIEKPLNEHMNWLQNRSDKMLQYLNQRGMPEWDFKTEYPKDAYVVRSGAMYQAQAQNIDKDPTLNTLIWKQPFAISGVSDNSNIEIQKIKNVDGYLTHYVKRSEPIMDAPCVGVAYYNKTRQAAFTFVKDTQLPAVTYNGNVVATFGTGASPKDVVTTDMLGAALQGYKVGDIYITTSSVDPKTRLGYGSWERFAQGEVLVGFSTSVSNSVPQWVKTAGTRFGAYEHKLSKEEMPTHKHGYNASHEGGNTRADGQGWMALNLTPPIAKHNETELDGSESLPSGSGNILFSSGGDKPHNNVQPSIVVYMWKRTA